MHFPPICSSSEGYFFSNQPTRNRTKPNKSSTDKAAGMFCVWMAQGGGDLICSIGVRCRVDFWLTLQLWLSHEGWHGKSKRACFISGIMLTDTHSYSSAASSFKNNNNITEALSSSITLIMANLLNIHVNPKYIGTEMWMYIERDGIMSIWCLMMFYVHD